MKKLMMVGLVMGALGAQAVGLVPASVQEMAKYGATHVLEIEHSDLVNTNVNTATVFTNVVTAPASIEFRGMLLDTAFDSTKTNVYFMTLSQGYTGATTKWLNAKQVAKDNTEVRSSFGTDYTAAGTTATALQVYNITTNYYGGIDSSVKTNVTVGTGTVTVTSPVLNEQSSNVSLVTTLSASGVSEAHADYDSGKVRLFWRILGPGYD